MSSTIPPRERLNYRMTCIRQNDQASVVDSAVRFAGTVASSFRIPTYPTEDLTQDILLKLLSMPKFIDDERRLEPFVRQMAKNLCRDHLRRQKHRKTEDILTAAASLAMPAEATTDSHAEDETVERLLKLASPADRVLLRLRYSEGLKVNEIATATQCKSSAVRQQLSRAIKTLRKNSSELRNLIR